MKVHGHGLPTRGPHNSPQTHSPAPDSPGSVQGEILNRLSPAERVRLMSDGVFNNTSLLISGLLSIVLVPIMLRGLGVESYGLWVAALSVAGTVGLFDFGLGMSVTREVAASLTSGAGSEPAPFVKSAGIIFCLVGIAGGIIIAFLGLPLSSGLHLSGANRQIAPSVFALAGVAFLADRLLGFTTGVLRGLRRFDITNLLVSVAAIIRGVGIIALIKLGTGLVAVMMWQVLAAAAAALAGQWAVGKIAGKFRFRVGRFDWSLVRPQLPFSLANQLTSIVEVIIWETAPLLVGLVLGSKWIAPYYIAQEFPIAVGPIIWTAAEALFPAVSQHQRDQNIAQTREILEVGTRWIVVVALPLCLGLGIVAPRLLQAWVGTVPPGSTLILRLITAAVFMEGIAAASIQVLWGRGAMRTLVIIPCCLMVTSLGLTLLLLPRLGFVGAAWGLSVPMFFASFVYLRIGARTCGIRVRDLLIPAFDGLPLPILVLLAAALGIQFVFRRGWAGVIATAMGGGLVYVTSFFWCAARPEERILVRKMMDAPATLGDTVYRGVRHALKRIDFLRSGYYFLLAAQEAFQDSPQRSQADLNREFEPRADHWDYTTNPYQTGRIRCELEMLDAVRGERRFEKGLEVGCAEGLFTQGLAERCGHLLAVDISSVALARARQRCDWGERVHFAEWDLRLDILPDTYDLIVMIHALEYIRNPFAIRRARAKLVKGLRPGGYLLVGTMRDDEMFEDHWWCRYLIRGGRTINNFLARHPALKLVKTAEFYLGKGFVSYDVLLQKKD